MKKLICIMAIILILLSGCGAQVDDLSQGETQKSMFVIIENTSLWKVAYHKESKVMYVISYGSYNYGTFTLLVNADGTPMIYAE